MRSKRRYDKLNTGSAFCLVVYIPHINSTQKYFSHELTKSYETTITTEGWNLGTDKLVVTESGPQKRKVSVSRSVVCDPMDCTRWVTIPFSRGSSQPRDRAQVSCTAGGFFTMGSLGTLESKLKTSSWESQEATGMLLQNAQKSQKLETWSSL